MIAVGMAVRQREASDATGHERCNLPITIWILAQVVLMALCSIHEGTCINNYSSLYRLSFEALNGTSVQQLLELPYNLFRNLLLILITAKDYGVVLRSSISTLSIVSRGIVDTKEESKEILQMSLWVPKFHKQDFDVT